MIKWIGITILLLPFGRLLSQAPAQDFKLKIPHQKDSGSLYSSLRFMDSRPDTTNMGFLELGPPEGQAKVVVKTSFSVQLQKVLASVIDSTAKNGQLLFQLKRLDFSEFTDLNTSYGYCNFEAYLYARTGDHYQKIASIDRVVMIKADEVTRGLFKQSSKMITDFLLNNINYGPRDTFVYTVDELPYIDSLEKQRIKVYHTPTYQDGMYLSYRSFKAQIPDKPITVVMKHGDIASVSTLDSDSLPVKVKSKNVYAIVFQGHPYIATNFGFYELEKRKGDFFFIGKAWIGASVAEYGLTQILYGLVGVLAVATDEATFEMKIDYVTGGFVRLREVEIPEDRQALH